MLRLIIPFVLSFLSITIFAQTGPGGVLNAGNNRFWFDANDLNLSDNDNISVWNNLGGNTTAATQTSSTFQPTFQSDITNSMNGYPVISFDGSDDLFDIADNADMNTSASYSRSYFMTIRTGTDITSRQVLFEEGGTVRGLNIYLVNGSIHIGAWNIANDGSDAPWGYSFVNTAIVPNTDYIIGFVMDGNATITGTIKAYLNGNNFGTINNVGRLYGHVGDIGIGGQTNDSYFENGSSSGDAHFFTGEVAEFIQYTIAFNDAQIDLIQNYLSSKYDIALSSGDYFFMDDILNGNYDHEVAGIGQASNGANSTDGQGQSILRCNGATGLSNGEFLIWGNDQGGFTETTIGTPTIVDFRLNQIWRFEETGDVGNVNLSFDINFLGLSGTVVTDFVLLIDGADTDFSDAIIVNASSLSGGIITFNGVDINSEDHVTLGINTSPQGNTGLGGVQNSDRYPFWFRAHDLSTSLNDGQTVSIWSNVGSNANNATQGTVSARPIYQDDIANTMNGYPVLDFQGNDNLIIPNNSDLNLAIASSRSLHMAFRTGANVTSTQILYEEGGTARGLNIYINGGNLFFGGWNDVSDGAGAPWSFESVSTPIASNTDYEFSMVYSGNASITGTIDCYLNGTLVGSILNVGVLYAHSGGIRIGSNNGTQIHTGTLGGSNSFFTGDIAEFAIYNYAVNESQRIIIDNYLTAKYGLVMNSSNHFVMDNPSNGDFDHDVAGIGQENPFINHTDAKGTGIVRISNSDNLNDGEYLIWGHNDDELCNTDDVPASVNTRLIRIWRASEVGDVGNVNLEFDLSDFDYGSIANARLLIDTDGVFSNATVISPTSTNGDIVIFSGVNLADENYFTIGTLDILTELTKDTTRWNGSVSVNWATATNWSAGVPDSNATVIISSSAPAMPIISTTASCFSIDIESGASLEISGNNELQVHGSWINNGSFIANTSHVNLKGSCGRSAINLGSSQEFFDLTINKVYGADIINRSIHMIGALNLEEGLLRTNDSLTFISDANGTARLTEITNGSISGEIEMQRYIDAGQTNWRFLTHAVSGANLEQFDDDFITSGIPGTDWPNWPSAANPWVSIFLYDENAGTTFNDGFFAPSSTAEIVGQGQGVWIWCGDTITGTQPFTIDSRGPANTGSIDLPVSFNATSGNMADDGWNMVANPYPCTIDWDETGWTKTNIENAIYIWNPDLGVYASYIAGASTNGGSQFVSSSQAFFVHANASNPVLTIEENCKIDQDQNFIKASSISTDLLRLQLSNGFEYNETVMRFDPLATNSYDAYADARKMTSSFVATPLLSSAYNGYEYSINTLNSDSLSLSVPLLVYPTQSSSTYSISAIDIAAIQHMNCVILEDLITGHKQNLLTDTTYSFTMTLAEPKHRFLLHFSQDIRTVASSVNCANESNGAVEINGAMVGSIYDVFGNGLTMSGVSHINNILLDSLAAGTYSINIIDAEGLCAPFTSQVVVANTPTLSYTMQTTPETCIGCCDGTITVLPLGGTGQITVWHNGMSLGQGNQLTGLCVGTYVFELIDDNGCNLTVTGEVENLTGVNDFDDIQFDIYPNPVKTNLNVSFTGLAQLHIYDINGRLLSGQTNSDGAVINVSNLASGIYLLKFSSSKGEEIKRFRVD